MATFYVGPRPVLRGVNTNDMVNPYTSMTGKAKGKGTYSYYPLYNTSHVLTGAPDNNHVPGTGYAPGDVFMSQIFRGVTFYIHPLSGTFPDGTATYDGARFRPLEYKGLAGSSAFPSGFGHVDRVSDYSYNSDIFDGVASANVFLNTGHSARTEAQGAPSSFGVFRPDEPHFVTSGAVFTATYGQAIPAGYDNEYGKNKVQEWRGLPSSKAL
jgi:hypothetical protein